MNPATTSNDVREVIVIGSASAGQVENFPGFPGGVDGPVLAITAAGTGAAAAPDAERCLAARTSPEPEPAAVPA